MNHLIKSKDLSYPMEMLYNTVLDIESYPQFIDEIASIYLINKKEHDMVADVTVMFGGIKACYRSNIKFNINHDSASVKIEASHGPFKHLSSKWHFTQKKNSTYVEFEIEFDLKSTILSSMASYYLDKVAEKIIIRFEKRVQELYDQKQTS